jgi:lysozyme family protein
MDNLQKALAFTLKWEGGYSNHPSDGGGETMRGVTKAVYDAYRTKKGLTIQSVKLLSDSELYDIYKNQYWTAAGCDKITNVRLAASVFDMAVNSGVARAKKYLALTSDYKKFNDNRSAYFEKIAKVNPKLQVFLKGWNNRINDLRKYVETL